MKLSAVNKMRLQSVEKNEGINEIRHELNLFFYLCFRNVISHEIFLKI